ncbi:hypothetical protein P153DRAFT_368361 [Dothidotthia symphoricarpi CBS 119687]|uniref:Secreted protein n=1 Tax=Dothidotthia symphoricarpi CBS 119687 TaxID=1392245 RepID=A0A6A6AAT3_9PLEO|nr:uncharacterized protein P153DRAFT_368361 [Dothidotthia symphoricarpi CBS 119687]KAF2127811.1 hypothetical protein P153DRAFT_368361 [Dothidotthia symphoricarpi CBS 119687]
MSASSLLFCFASTSGDVCFTRPESTSWQLNRECLHYTKQASCSQPAVKRPWTRRAILQSLLSHVYVPTLAAPTKWARLACWRPTDRHPTQTLHGVIWANDWWSLKEQQKRAVPRSIVPIMEVRID